MEVLTDSNGNKCSVAYFGSVEAAQKAIDSLKRCSDCSDCSYCSGCSDCSYCSYCSDCSRCSGAKPIFGDPLPIPIIENIHRKVYEAVSFPGHKLNMGSWHTCETTHCRAGWVVHLAGEQGKALEDFHSTELASMLIYRASSPHRVSPARFYDSNLVAMADMKRMAELEASGQ